MSIQSGIAAQLGGKAESVYGTPVTVDRFWEFYNETIKDDVRKVRSATLRNARFQRADRVKTNIAGAAGSIEYPFTNKNMGLLLQHAVGQDTITGSGADKTHTIIPDTAAQQGKFMTVQVGRPDSAGTIEPFTYEGGKVTGWHMKCAIDEDLRLVLDWDFQNVLTGTALASASYPATMEVLNFAEGALTVGGVAIPIRSFALDKDNGLKTDRRFLGNTKLEPLANALAALTGSLEAEFGSLTRHTAWLAGTQAQLVLTFTSPTLIPTTAVPFSATITIPKVEYTGDTPNVAGPDVLNQPAPFMALDDGTNPVYTIAYVTSDTAA